MKIGDVAAQLSMPASTMLAFGCAMAALYAYLLGSYPFLIAESIWSVIALRWWYGLRQDA